MITIGEKKLAKSCDEHVISVSELSDENNLSLVDRRGLLEHLIRCSLQSKGTLISEKVPNHAPEHYPLYPPRDVDFKVFLS